MIITICNEDNSKSKHYLYDSKGNSVIIKNDYNVEYYTSFSDGLSMFYAKNKYGYIDDKGNVVIKPIYTKAKLFSEDLAPVSIKK